MTAIPQAQTRAIERTIPFYLHNLTKAELAAVAEVVAGPILTTGDVTARFEERFASYLRRRHAVGVTSCTAAIHLALVALGVGPGDEVITTPMTFIATATAILHAGALPVFVDVEPDTGNLDATRIEAAITPRTRAVLPVHLYGQMCDMRAIREVAHRHRLFVVEDCAHCLAGSRDGVTPGQLADAACFSFYATKELTCGEGGAIVTDSEELAGKLRLLRLHGMTATAADRYRGGYKHWDMALLGWKYNMADIQAALLVPQLERLDANLQRRLALADRYGRGLRGMAGVALPGVRPGVSHARYVFPVLIQDGRRDDVIAALQGQRIGVAVQFRAIHLLTYFQQAFGFRAGDFPAAEQFGNETLCLPFYPSMPDEYVDRTVAALGAALAG